MEIISKSKYSILFVLALIFIVRTFFYIQDKSVHFDEIIYPAAGYMYWTEKAFFINNETPPLSKLVISLPLLFFDLKKPDMSDLNKTDYSYQFILGDRFLKINKSCREDIILFSRLTAVFISLIVFFVLYKFVLSIADSVAAVFSVFWLSMSPNIIAYSGIANIDIFMCLLIFWFVCVCQIYLKHPTLKNSIFFGIITGLSFAVKSSAVIEIIIMLSFMVIHYCKTNEPEENAGIIDFIEMRFRKLSVSFIVALIILLTSYFFVGIPEYLNGLKDIASGILKGKTNIFFAGLYSMNGFWFYYFGVYLLKTASPEILLALIFIFYIFKHSILIKYPELFNFIIAAVIIFFAISLSNFQTGMRYMLPVYPILAVFLGVTSSFMIKLKGKSRMFLFILTLWMSVSSFNTHPDYLAYFNELTSLSADGKNNSNLLADCNVDWGQDLKKLKTRLNKYPNSFLVFSYFGNDDPEEYGIEYLELAPRTRIKLNPKTPQYFDKNRILLAVSKTNFTGVYYPGDMDLFAWLKILEPVENIGNSILVYDITNSKIALQKIIEIYEIQNKTKEMEILRFFLSKINS